MASATTLPSRGEVDPRDTWDLSGLYADDAAWESDFETAQREIPKYAAFQGRLGESAEVLAECLALDSDLDRLFERLGSYAFLKTTEDQTNQNYQRLMGRLQSVASKAGQAASYIRPELLAIEDSVMEEYLRQECLQRFKLSLERILRYRPHTLSDKEERLLAMQSEMAGAAGKAFRQLLDADLKFGTVVDEKGRDVELTNANFMQFLISPKREVRKTAFHQYYRQFKGHENTLAATLAGSIHKDVYYARARNYPSALSAALFADDVPMAVYDNLIASVRRSLPALQQYYDLRRRKMNLPDIHHYDTYVPILSDLDINRTWEQAVTQVMGALEPLGSEYCEVLQRGLTTGRWCDRYPNQGKQSGAFSCGSYDGEPYILMNYKNEVFDDVFTLAHEAGHSMHSYFCAQHQSFENYNYVIFVAEVASTFNEQLLSRKLIEEAADDRQRAYLINHELDGIRGTIIRQTMFAEFEKVSHELAESGEALTVQAFQDAYRKLLDDYFGPEFVIDEDLSLECFRIPHFYRAFYVYQYATGLSAAIALSQRVLDGGEQELADYLGFLKAGRSKYPLELLKDAGVDMTQPGPVDTALARFASLVEELDNLLA